MYQYLVTAPQVKVHEGFVQLDEEQAGKREYGIAPTQAPGVYEVTKTLYFINGLTFGHDRFIEHGVECLNGSPASASAASSDITGELETKSATDSGDDGDEGIVIETVKDLAEALGLKIKETLDLLKNKYAAHSDGLTKGADEVSDELLEAMIASGDITGELEE